MRENTSISHCPTYKNSNLSRIKPKPGPPVYGASSSVTRNLIAPQDPNSVSRDEFPLCPRTWPLMNLCRDHQNIPVLVIFKTNIYLKFHQRPLCIFGNWRNWIGTLLTTGTRRNRVTSQPGLTQRLPEEGPYPWIDPGYPLTRDWVSKSTGMKARKVTLVEGRCSQTQHLESDPFQEGRI